MNTHARPLAAALALLSASPVAADTQSARAAFSDCLANYIGSHGRGRPVDSVLREAAALCRPQEIAFGRELDSTVGASRAGFLVDIVRRDGEDAGLRALISAETASKRP